MASAKTMLSALLLSTVFIVDSLHAALALEVGDKAPEFELDSTKGGKIKLSSLKGKNVLIQFYVSDFDPT